MDLRNCCQGEHMEKFDFGRKKLLGIVFDLSIRHDKQGGRIIDMVKKQLVSRIASSDENLLVVVSDADNKVPRMCGGGIHQIDSYIDPVDFRIGEANRRIASVVGDSVEDSDKYIVIITDRFNGKFKGHYRALFDAKKNKNYEYKVGVIAIGDHCDFSLLKDMVNENNGIFLISNNMDEFNSALTEIGV
jgi:hypothetical protein